MSEFDRHAPEVPQFRQITAKEVSGGIAGASATTAAYAATLVFRYIDAGQPRHNPEVDSLNAQITHLKYAQSELQSAPTQLKYSGGKFFDKKIAQKTQELGVATDHARADALPQHPMTEATGFGLGGALVTALVVNRVRHAIFKRQRRGEAANQAHYDQRGQTPTARPPISPPSRVPKQPRLLPPKGGERVSAEEARELQSLFDQPARENEHDKLDD